MVDGPLSSQSNHMLLRVLVKRLYIDSRMDGPLLIANEPSCWRHINSQLAWIQILLRAILFMLAQA